MIILNLEECYKVIRFVLYDDNLYRRGFNQLLLKFVDEEEGHVVGEIHEVICGNHA